MFTVTRIMVGALLIGVTSVACAPVRKVEFNPFHGKRARSIVGKRLNGAKVEKQWIEALGNKSNSQDAPLILIRRADGITLKSCCDITSQVVIINGQLSSFRKENDSPKKLEGLGPVDVIGKFRIDYLKRLPRIEEITHDIKVLVRLIGTSPNLVVECAVKMQENDRNQVQAVYGHILWMWITECDRGFCSGRKN